MKTRGMRLKKLREDMNLSLDDLSNYLDVSRDYVMKLEDGEKILTVTIVDKLCDLYCCDAGYLLCMNDDYIPLKFALRRENISINDLNVIVKVNKLYKNMVFLNKKLGLSDDLQYLSNFGAEVNADSGNTLNKTADEVRKLWNLSEYKPADIIKLSLLNIPNLTVLFAPMSCETSGMAINNNNIQMIAINSNMSVNMQEFTFAHELYYLLGEKDRFQTVICNIYEKSVSQKNGDAFASFLLMSYEALMRYIDKNNINEWNLENILEIEQYFKINHHSMLIRLKNNKLISESEFKRYFNVDFASKIENANIPKKSVIGNYFNLIEKAYRENLLFESKKREFLLDGFKGNQVFRM